MDVIRNAPRMETIKNTAKLLGISENFVRKKVLAGEIVAVKAQSRYLVNVDKLVEYLNTSTVSSAPKGGTVNG